MKPISPRDADAYPLQEPRFVAITGRIVSIGRSRARSLLQSFLACWKLFASGGAWEFLLTVDLIVTAEKNIAAAGAMSALNTVVWGYFLYKLIEAKTRRKEAIVWMALGGALGCMLGTWMLK